MYNTEAVQMQQLQNPALSVSLRADTPPAGAAFKAGSIHFR